MNEILLSLLLLSFPFSPSQEEEIASKMIPPLKLKANKNKTKVNTPLYNSLPLPPFSKKKKQERERDDEKKEQPIQEGGLLL